MAGLEGQSAARWCSLIARRASGPRSRRLARHAALHVPPLAHRDSFGRRQAKLRRQPIGERRLETRPRQQSSAMSGISEMLFGRDNRTWCCRSFSIQRVDAESARWHVERSLLAVNLLPPVGRPLEAARSGV
jgi:hypothetical protein